MRTPNCKCVVCGKPLYRRPGELKRVRHVACMEHRGLAQSLSGVTEKQKAALSLGRVKGTNHRSGYRHSEDSKRKASAANKRFWSENKELLEARGAKIRGAHHYKWNGGISRLNMSVRRMTENRKWMDAIKSRDGMCLECLSTERLEAHHIRPLSELIEKLGIKNREDARRFASELWDLENGITLCRRCHYKKHGRTLNENRRNEVRSAA